MSSIIDIVEVLQVFGLSEEDQERYFPEFSKNKMVSFGAYDPLETRSARMVALCVLEELTARRSVATISSHSIYDEINGLAFLMIESTFTWKWIVRHPRAVRMDETSDDDPLAVDIRLYKVWSVMRRLCLSALESEGECRCAPRRPFELVFRDAIREA